jgi:hypothetical protein
MPRCYGCVQLLRMPICKCLDHGRNVIRHVTRVKRPLAGTVGERRRSARWRFLGRETARRPVSTSPVVLESI